nr:14030_t:CDS:2 [Entrophospora candida]
MTSQQQSDSNKETYGTAVSVNNPGSSPQHEPRFFSSKRAREIQAEEGITTNFRPTPLTTQPITTNGAFSNGTLLPDSVTTSISSIDYLKPVGSKVSSTASNGNGSEHFPNYPSSYRRTRADTLPSSLSRPMLHYPPSTISLSSSNPIGSSSNSNASSLLTPPSRSSRIRSGSLTLPSSSLSAAFGPSIFTSGWNESSGPPTPPMQTPTTGDLLRGDENNTVGKTLDYLGLDDHDHSSSSMSKLNANSNAIPQIKVEMKPPTTSGYSSQTGGAIPSLRRDSNRIRSYSVSATAKYDDPPIPTTTSSNITNNLFPPGNVAVQQFHQVHNRPRAISMSILDLPNDITTLRQRNYNDMTDQIQSATSSNRLGGDQLLEMIPRVSDHSQQSTPPPQTPTRSLWIGNIDPNLTTQDLMQLFSHYGGIESLRLLPDKECGFVNFVRVEDAIRAKDDIMNRLGGRVGNCIVRVGYGKADVLNNQDFSMSFQTQLQPTRALWIGNIPTSTTPQTLENIFAPYGAIEYARVLTHKNCGFVNFENLEDAITAKKALHGKEVLGSAVGNVRIGFAKVQPKPSPNATTPEPESPATRHAQKQLMMRELSGGLDDDLDDDNGWKPDASRLREIRKRLDSNHCTAKEVEAIALEVIDESVELASDYIGNTVIQKLFERCSENTKTKMLEKLAPHLATIGIHKNGTWAAQKIIECAKTPTQVQIIASNVKPFTPPLLLDQFGNYVVQCCLRLNQRNQFIFDAMVDRCCEIAQGRFGARAMRTCLESQYVTKKQQKQVAISIIINAVSLSTNPNGALLLTWMLDNSNFPGRYRLLAPRLAPHLAHLCTHKLASLTVLKIINQRQEPDARELTISSLFFSPNDQVLEDVLNDQVHGVGVVQKVLSSPYLDPHEKQKLVDKVKYVLGKLKVQQVQGYKRLLEELGMVGDVSFGNSLNPGGPTQLGMAPQGVFPGQMTDIAAAAAYYAAAQAAFANQQMQQASNNASPIENNSNNSAQNDQFNSQQQLLLSPSSEGTAPTQSSTSLATTPSTNYPPPTSAAPVFMNNVPLSPHHQPHPQFPPTSPYTHMAPFPPFIHPTALAAVAAGMYGHSAMFNPAYPYIIAAGGMPPPMINSAPPTPNGAPNPILSFTPPPPPLTPQLQQQSQQELNSDMRAQSSPKESGTELLEGTSNE